jgi:rod shape-determining protein MreB and related proteins
MFTALRPVLYIKLSPERLTVRNVRSGESVSEVPEMAISTAPKQAILAVGSEARRAAGTQDAKVVNPFNHPRTLVGDFTVGEQLLKTFVRKLQGSSLVAIAPLIVMHPLGSPKGGFTQVERRAFREMALGAGASKVVLWVGHELSDAEVLSDQVLSSEPVDQ